MCGAVECRTNVFLNGGVHQVVAVIREGNEETLPHALRVVINLTADGTPPPPRSHTATATTLADWGGGQHSALDTSSTQSYGCRRSR
jgi:hypothetical protein